MRRMSWIAAALMIVLLFARGASAGHPHGGLYRGAIANNDYGYGGNIGSHHHLGAHSLGGSSFYGHGGFRGGYGNYGGFGGYSSYYNNYGGYRGYSAYRPYYNNWSGVSINIGSPYYGYYGNPYYGGYYGGPFGYGYGYGYYGSSYLGSGLYDYGTYYHPRANYVDYSLPSIYYPAELSYGPQAMKQFLGLDRTFGLGPLLNNTPQVNQPVVIQRNDSVRETARPVVQEINWEARKKADNFIEIGDQRFKEQKFHDALLRYRMAIEASPDYAIAHLRHGFSLIANRRYEEAAKALTKAFTLDPQIVKSGFRIDQLYADNRLAREAHEEGLAQAVLDEPSSGALHYVMGMWLVFSGDLDRSRKFFEKARELGVDTGSIAEADAGGRDL